MVSHAPLQLNSLHSNRDSSGLSSGELIDNPNVHDRPGRTIDFSDTTRATAALGAKQIALARSMDIVYTMVPLC